MYWVIVLFLLNLPYQEATESDTYSIHQLIEILTTTDEIAKEWSPKVSGLDNSMSIKLLLVTDSIEYLIGYSNRINGFVASETLSFNGQAIYKKATSTNTGFKATYPLSNGIPTIVIGTPENTGLDLGNWVLTILHEHFHLLQMNGPNYFQEVESLDLSGGDQTGMWMLNYDFPYADPVVSKMLSDLGHNLADGIENGNVEILEIVTGLQEELTPEDFRYMEFQLWQEGIARYIEHEYSLVLDELKDELRLKKGRFNEIAQEKLMTGLKNLRTINAYADKRVVFYDLGWGIGMILGRMNKQWKQDYWKDRFTILDQLHE